MAFSYYRVFTIDHTKVPSDQTNFPVVISGTYSWAAGTGSGGRSQNANGFDLRPYTSTALSSAMTYQLRSYNATTGAFNMVVLVSTLSSSVDGTIVIAMGDAALTTDGSSTAVWDSNFKAVYALGDGTTLSLADSTSNGNTLTNTNSVTATSSVAGGMGAASFNGSTQDLGITGAPVTADPLTIEALFNPNENTTNGVVVGLGSSTNATNGARELTKRATNVMRTAHIGNTSGLADSGGSAYTVSAWNYAASTANSLTSRDIHPNGATKTSNVTVLTSINAANRFSIGCRNTNAKSSFFAGSVGEVRLSNVTRADDWIKTTKNNLVGIATFYSVGGEVPIGSVKPAPAALFQFTHR